VKAGSLRPKKRLKAKERHQWHIKKQAVHPVTVATPQVVVLA
jgi:hypothetical protein